MSHRPGSALLLLAAALSQAAPLPVAAQGVPDLVGTWRGAAQAVLIGPTPYRAPEREGANFADAPIEFVYRITRQEGNRFTGELTSGTRRETIIGAVHPENRGGVMLDDDGQYSFTLRGPDAMDLCYAHLYPSSKVVACWTVTRAR